MATEVIKIVDPDNDTGTDYTSLSAWEAAEQADITAATGNDTIVIAECRSSSGTADTTGLNINGFTTSSGNYVEIRAISGQEAIKTEWDTSIYRLSVTDDDGMDINDNHIRLRGLQIESIYSTATFKFAVLIRSISSGDSDIRVDGCRFRGINVGNIGGFRINSVYANLKFWNNIISPTTNVGMRLQINTAELYNNVIANMTEGGDGIKIDNPGGTFTLKNNAIFNTGDDIADDSGGNATITIDYLASDDGDGTNSVAPSGADWDNEFLDNANGDFTLLSTGNLREGGTDDPGSGLYSTDMEGDSYVSPWDIGVDEFFVVSDVDNAILFGMNF